MSKENEVLPDRSNENQQPEFTDVSKLAGIGLPVFLESRFFGLLTQEMKNLLKTRSSLLEGRIKWFIQLDKFPTLRNDAMGRWAARIIYALQCCASAFQERAPLMWKLIEEKNPTVRLTFAGNSYYNLEENVIFLSVYRFYEVFEDQPQYQATIFHEFLHVVFESLPEKIKKEFKEMADKNIEAFNKNLIDYAEFEATNGMRGLMYMAVTGEILDFNHNLYYHELFVAFVACVFGWGIDLLEKTTSIKYTDKMMAFLARHEEFFGKLNSPPKENEQIFVDPVIARVAQNNFVGDDLRGLEMDMRWCLRNYDFSEANMQGAIISGEIKGRFEHTDFRGACFSVGCRDVDFSGSDLRGADLSRLYFLSKPGETRRVQVFAPTPSGKADMRRSRFFWHEERYIRTEEPYETDLSRVILDLASYRTASECFIKRYLESNPQATPEEDLIELYHQLMHLGEKISDDEIPFYARVLIEQVKKVLASLELDEDDEIFILIDGLVKDVDEILIKRGY